MPSKQCKNPSCAETDPKFYAHRNLCKKCYLEQNREREKGYREKAKANPNIRNEIKELKSIIDILMKRLDEITIDIDRRQDF